MPSRPALLGIAFLLLVGSCAHCPKSCSRNGVCHKGLSCKCMPGYKGVDCSKKSCPKGRGFPGKGRPGESAHPLMICSGSGLCDSTTGRCQCFLGFSGPACQATFCPRGCSGNGQCLSMRSLSKSLGRTPYIDGSTHGWRQGWLHSWEGNSMFACKCDPGFTGPDCSYRTCPSNDDPATNGHTGRSVRLSISHAHRGLTSGDTLSFVFGSQHASFSVSDAAATIQHAIESMENINSAIVSKTGGVTTAGDVMFIYISIVQFTRHDTHWFQHNGNPPLSFFFCDTTGSHGGLRATVANNATDAMYTVQVLPSGNEFRWKNDGVGSAWSTGVLISAAGNTELTPTDRTVKLVFSPIAGRPPGEEWRVVIAGGRGSVIPETVCAIVDTDLSMITSGTYVGSESFSYRVKLTENAASGLGNFVWRTERVSSTSPFSSPAAVTPGVGQLIGVDGVAITFSSGYGHTPGSEWTIDAKPPGATLETADVNFLVAQGRATSVAGNYRLWIDNAAMSPFSYAYETFDISTGTPVVGHVAGASLSVSFAQNGNAVPHGIAPGVSQNGFYAVFSSVSMILPLAEWIVLLANGGAAITVPRPSMPVKLEASAGTLLTTSHVVTISATNQFTHTTTIAGVTTAHGPTLIADWWTGNAELGNGLLLRFYTKVGYRIGTVWRISASVGAAKFLLSSETALNVSTSGATLSAYYYVRIVSSANSADEFSFSLNGVAWLGPFNVKSPLDITGNVELGNGIRLSFATTTGYAPGQLWLIKISSASVNIVTIPTVKEFTSCSGRGLCSASTGTCACFSGFIGADCSEGVTSIRTDGLFSSPTFRFSGSGSLFTGDLVKLSSQKSPASDFNFVTATAGGVRVFLLRGDGHLQPSSITTSTLTSTLGITAQGEGIHVMEGGATINKARLPATDVLTVTATVSGAGGFTGSVMRVDSIEDNTIPSGSFADHYLIRAFTSLKNPATPNLPAASTERFRVRSDGQTSLLSGGLYVANPVSAQSDGTTARSQPFFGGATIEGGVTVSSYGITILNGGISVNNDPRNGALAHKPGNVAASSDDTVVATASDVGFTGSVFRGNAASSSSTSYKLLRLQAASSDVFVVRGDGQTTISAGGLQVVSGGVSVGGPSGAVGSLQASATEFTVSSSANSHIAMKASDVTAGAGGSVSLAGGSTSTGVQGGHVMIQSGASGPGGTSGHVSLTAATGVGSLPGSFQVSGGGISLSVSSHALFSSSAGSVSVVGVTGVTLKTSGSAILMDAGTISLPSSGTGVVVSDSLGAGGAISLVGGSNILPAGGAAGGGVLVQGGSSPSGTGGSVSLVPGTGTVNGEIYVNGDMRTRTSGLAISVPTAAASGGGSISLIGGGSGAAGQQPGSVILRAGTNSADASVGGGTVSILGGGSDAVTSRLVLDKRDMTAAGRNVAISSHACNDGVTAAYGVAYTQCGSLSMTAGSATGLAAGVDGGDVTISSGASAHGSSGLIGLFGGGVLEALSMDSLGILGVVLRPEVVPAGMLGTAFSMSPARNARRSLIIMEQDSVAGQYMMDTTGMPDGSVVIFVCSAAGSCQLTCDTPCTIPAAPFTNALLLAPGQSMTAVIVDSKLYTALIEP